MRRHKFIDLALCLAGCILLLAAACDSPATVTSSAPTAVATHTAQSLAPRQPAVPPSNSPAANCTPVANITISNANSTRCATGLVRSTSKDSLASYLGFGTDFYLLSYELDLTAIPRNTCVIAKDKVKRLGSHPVIVVAHTAPLYECDTGKAIPLPLFQGQGLGPAPAPTSTKTLTSTQPPPPPPATTAPRVRIGATCANGWASNATGSGACSHHGGVSCWRYSDGSCTKP